MDLLPPDRIVVAFVGSAADLDALRLALIATVATPEVDQGTREVCARAAAQIGDGLELAEEEDDEEREHHAPGVVLPFARRESRS
jgi:hypothetical protein